MKKSLLIVLGIGILIVTIINVFLSNPTFEKLSEKIEHAEKTNQPKQVESFYFTKIERNPSDITSHYRYINAHFNIPLKRKISKNNYEYRDDDTILSYYKNKAGSFSEVESDIGRYGLGLVYVNLKNYEAGLKSFFQVKNKELKYLNNSIGNAYLQLGDVILAEEYFKKAILAKGNVAGATSNLSKMYLNSNKLEELDELLLNEITRDYIPFSVLRKYNLLNGKFLSYIEVLFLSVFGGMTLIGSLGALLILCIWVVYIRKLDIYEPESWKPILLTIGLGIIFSLFTFVLSDINQELFGFKLTGEIVNDFFFSVLGIGAIEEFVKIIPLFLLLKYTDYVNESYDYIFYASLSALGFAFLENLLYFNQYQLHIISSRALLTSVGHMFMTSIIAYGLILNKYRYKSNSILRFLLFFILASLAHGFYDFWLINEKVSDFRFLSILFFISGISVWNSFKNNALNHSEFYDNKKMLNQSRISNFLLYSLSGVILFEYLAISLKFGPTAGNKSFFESILSGAYILMFITSGLGQFKVKEGKWMQIRFWGTKDEKKYPSDINEIVEQMIRLSQFSRHEFQKFYLPTNAEVVKRYEIGSHANWYLVKLNEKGGLEGFHSEYLIIRPKESHKIIKSSKSILVGVYLIKQNASIETDVFDINHLDFIHWARAIKV